MTFKVIFKKEHNSIKAMPETELPGFVVLTGINGSGKTHFLEAIGNGSLAISINGEEASSPLLISLGDMQDIASEPFSPSDSAKNKQQQKAALKVRLKSKEAAVEKFFTERGVLLEEDWAQDISKFLDLRNWKHDPHSQSQTLESFTNNSNAWSQQLPAVLEKHRLELIAELPAAANSSDVDLAFLLSANDDELDSLPELRWTSPQLFQNKLGEVFGLYRKHVRDNAARESLFQKGQTDACPLSDIDFEKAFGRPPWDVVNEMLQANGLDFRINSPKLEIEEEFIPKLIKTSTSAPIDFQNLSGGEKVILKVITCIFNSVDPRSVSGLPDILLLDEIDAPLHPSMIRGLLRSLSEVLVKDKKLKVILTTHNPTTIALADEGSVFIMNPDGPIVQKTSKKKALEILTVGVPTLSLSYEGRRQVYVESDTDVKILEKLYQVIIGSVDTGFSLNFTSVGFRDQQNGEQHAGCDRVKSVVKTLRANEVTTVFGLIDWDLKNAPADGIFVLCENQRYSIENLVLDPVFVLFYLAQNYLDFCRTKIDKDDFVTVRNMLEWDKDKWQKNVDLLTKIVFPKAAVATAETQYGDKFTLKVPKVWYETKGHELENKLVKTISPFGIHCSKHPKFQEKLVAAISEETFSEYSDFLPKDLGDTFKKMLT